MIKFLLYLADGDFSQKVDGNDIGNTRGTYNTFVET